MTRLCSERHGDKASIRMTHLFGYAYYPTLCIIGSIAPLRIPNFTFDTYQIIHYSSAKRFHHSLFIRATSSRPYAFTFHFPFHFRLRGLRGTCPRKSPFIRLFYLLQLLKLRYCLGKCGSCFEIFRELSSLDIDYRLGSLRYEAFV